MTHLTLVDIKFLNIIRKARSAASLALSSVFVAGAAAVFCFSSLTVCAQRSDSAPVVVQPGAPGQGTQVLPASTRAKLPPRSAKDIEFMQGMIMHHAQAVEMTDLIESRTENKDIRMIGARISKSQSDEMEFMQRWLEVRSESTSMKMPDAPDSHSHGSHSSGHQMLMPGMLSAKQMDELKKAKGAEFDRLFLAGMIQHHQGALVMVKDLFETAGAGHEAELFSFATDVDTGQRAEIKSMETLLNKKP